MAGSKKQTGGDMNLSIEQLSLNLTIGEMNTILEALGHQPYASVFLLIDKIKAQSQAQLQSRPSQTYVKGEYK
jgi:hypothetical protein